MMTDSDNDIMLMITRGVSPLYDISCAVFHSPMSLQLYPVDYLYARLFMDAQLVANYAQSLNARNGRPPARFQYIFIIYIFYFLHLYIYILYYYNNDTQFRRYKIYTCL